MNQWVDRFNCEHLPFIARELNISIHLVGVGTGGGAAANSKILERG